jgi:hypothetical protein
MGILDDLCSKKDSDLRKEVIDSGGNKNTGVMTTEPTKEMTVLLRKKRVIKAAGNLISSD